MNTPIIPRGPGQGGYSLIVTLVVTGVAAVVFAATMQRTMTVARQNDRSDQFLAARAAAEAATEKVLSRMMVDFAQGGEQALSNNLTYYRTSLLPSSSESSYWTNYQFSDGQSNFNATYVARTTTNANPPYVTLLQQYPGLNAFAATYRVLSQVQSANSGYNFNAVVLQDIQMAEIPVFQFALFYNSLMEFSDCAPLTVSGRVNCNSNIYVGTISGSYLTFSYDVTAAGTITNPAWFGFTQSQWQGPITYSGTPSPGYGTGQPVLTLPVGTNNSAAAVYQILQQPPNGESHTNPISVQRYFNKADLILNVTDSNIVLTLKNSMYDGSPIVLSNNAATNTAAWTNWKSCTNIAANWFLNTNVYFYDQRQGQSNKTTQIDIGLLGTWMSTNTNCTTKWTTVTPFNGVMYVYDTRTTNATYMDAVRLINGANITNGTQSNSIPNGLYQSGLTIATINPLYVAGFYNCPNSAFRGTTNTTVSRPCSFVCDALTILSPNWVTDNYDSLSGSGISYTSRPATLDTVNAAIIAGNVPSTGSSSTQYSGGVQNLPRLLEDWTSQTLTLNTSMINLFPSVYATAQFQKPGIYYEPPTRQFQFDLNFTTSTGLPPGTPLVNRMVRADWAYGQPNNVAYTPSPTLGFVPQ